MKNINEINSKKIEMISRKFMKKLLMLFIGCLSTTSIYSMNIFEAASKGNIERIKELIAADLSVVNQKDYDGWTPLYLAAYNGQQKAVQILIDNHANVNQQDKWGNTPLHPTAAIGHPIVVQVLIANGANINQQNKVGMTALKVATSNGHQKIVDLINRVNAASHDANQQLLVLLCAGHRRLGAASPLQPIFHAHGAIARALAPFVRKAALEYAIYQQPNQ